MAQEKNTLEIIGYDDKFTIVNNAILNESRLSWKAKGIYLHLVSQKKGWHFYTSEVQNHATDGKDSLNSGLAELEKFGYLKRIRSRDGEGKFKGMTWIVSAMPQMDYPQMDYPQMDNPQLTNTNSNYNKTITNTNSNKDILSSKHDVASPPYNEIIEYLNQRTGKSFRATSKATRRCINARYNEGFTLQDFKDVIDKKCVEWINDEKMAQYLRPETLFGTKFEGYLNQQVVKGKENKEWSFMDFSEEDIL